MAAEVSSVAREGRTAFAAPGRDSRTAATSKQLTILTVAVTGFLVALPLVIVDDPFTGNAALLTAIACYAGGRLAWHSTLSAPTVPIYAFFWLFVYVFLGLAPLVQRDLNVRPLGNAVTVPDERTAALVVIGFLVAFEVGSRLGRARPTVSPSNPDQVSVARLRLLVALGVLAVGYEISRVGIGTLFTSRATIAESLGADSASTAITAIHSALLGLPLFIVAYVLLAKRRFGLRDRPSSKAVALAVIAALVVSNPISSSRYAFGTVALSLLLLAVHPISRRMNTLLVLGSLVALTIVFRIFNQFRFDDRRAAATEINSLRESLLSGDYDAFQQLINTVSLVRHSGFVPQQILGPLTFWVPRSLWAEKPIDTGVLLGQSRGYINTNLSAPVMAEAYIAGGIVAVGLVGLALGFSYRRLVSHFRRSGPTDFVGLLVPVLAVYQLILLRGSLLQATGGIVVIAGALTLVTSRRARRDHEHEEPVKGPRGQPRSIASRKARS